MKPPLKPLLSLFALAATLTTLTFGCCIPADDPQPAPQTGDSAAKSGGSAAPPPKTHD